MADVIIYRYDSILKQFLIRDLMKKIIRISALTATALVLLRKYRAKGIGAAQKPIWGIMDGRNSRIIGLSMMDISTILEFDNAVPPVMFKDRENLIRWGASRRLFAEKIGKFSENDALRIRGSYLCQDGCRFEYNQIWVRAKYKGYARVLRNIAEKSFKHDHGDMRGIDADHVINRARLQQFPEAWVMLFPVPKGPNRGFGGKIEKYLPKPDARTVSIELPPLIAFKLLCGKLPSTMSELTHAMQSNIRGRIMQDVRFAKEYCDQMEKDVAKFMSDTP